MVDPYMLRSTDHFTVKQGPKHSHKWYLLPGRTPRLQNTDYKFCTWDDDLMFRLRSLGYIFCSERDVPRIHAYR